MRVWAIKDEAGNITELWAIVRDITDRKRVEEALRESQEIYKTLAEKSMAGVYVVQDGKFRFINFNAAFYAGYTREELLGQKASLLVSPEDMGRVKQNARAMLRGETSSPYEFRIITKQGETRWIMETVISILHEGRPAILGNSMNITESKQAEEVMRERDIQFKKLSSWVPGMIYQFTKRPDGTYCIPFTTEAIKDILGCSPQDVREDFSPIARVILPEDFDKVIGSIEYSAKHLTIWTCEYRVQIPGQSIRWMLGHSTPEKLADGGITWYGFITDITERKQVENMLCESEEKYRSLFENSIMGISQALPDGRIITANTAYAQMYGYANAEEIMVEASSVGQRYANPEDREEVLRILKEKGLKDIDFPWPVARIVLEHHERINGSGYPNGLTGDNILMESRIMSVADVVESMASYRPYRPALGIDAALKEIEKNRGALYDTGAVDACVRLFREKGFQLP
jgi:PAS domain S-box-containing protein